MRILIIGAGAVGFYLARRLSAESLEVVVVDRDPAKVEHVADNLDVLSLHGNGADPETLRDAGLVQTDILMAVSGVDEVNLIACFAAERNGVPVKVARVRNPERYGPGGLLPMDALGVDLLIGPEQECAWELFQLLNNPAATDLVRFANGRVQLAGMRIQEGAPVVGRSLAQMDRDFKGRRFMVAAVVRDGRTQIPTGTTVLEAGDKIFVLAPSQDMGSLPPLAGFEAFSLRRVMIGGGSDEAVYLARHLAQHGVQVTIFERDAGRCRALAELLPGALILKGDTTDMELLEMEGVEGIDGFVTVTDRDEVNMLAALLAKSCGARRVIPLLHKVEYMELVERVGLDAAVSPRVSAANAILRFVRRGDVAAVATLKGSDAEVVESVVHAGAPIVGKRLREVEFPKGALVGAIVRDDEVLVPRGRDRIEPDDHLICFVLSGAIPALERLLT